MIIETRRGNVIPNEESFKKEDEEENWELRPEP